MLNLSLQAKLQDLSKQEVLIKEKIQDLTSNEFKTEEDNAVISVFRSLLNTVSTYKQQLQETTK